MTEDDKLQAIKISQALQDYFDTKPFQRVLRSPDAYDILVRKKVVEADRHSGIKFRDFLKKLKNDHALHYIPQCRAEETNGNITNWFFESAKNKTISQRNLSSLTQIDRPKTINIEDIKQQIQNLPKMDPIRLTLLELQTRKNYPRAYEYWSGIEEEILINVVREISDSFKLSDLFGRQPSAIQTRLKDKYHIVI